MKQLFLTFAFSLLTSTFFAQTDSLGFRGYLVNKEFDVYMKINLYANSVVIPGQEYYGKLPGYLGKTDNPFCWVIVDAEVKSDNEARLTMINDYGSEDLEATLIRQNDSLYVLRQGAGSTIKIPKNRKWQKLPRTIEFLRKK